MERKRKTWKFGVRLTLKDIGKDIERGQSRKQPQHRTPTHQKTAAKNPTERLWGLAAGIRDPEPKKTARRAVATKATPATRRKAA